MVGTRLVKDLDKNIKRWKEEALPLSGKKLVRYHADLTYFAERFGMQQAGTIEIRAGIDPTPGHVQNLIEQMRKDKVGLVVRERHYPAGLSETISKQTGAKLLVLPVMVGGVPAKTYVDLIDYDLHALLQAAAH